MTSNVERRLHEHNTKAGRWTSSFKPWVLVALEEFGTRKEAGCRERFLKSRAGIRQRKELFEESIGGESVERP
jgi:predicted GIY-YIG superfamily endonuclease